jgi:polysaccharide pyruvyl transferase CsaB
MRILICGYYGFNNAGDELILENLVTQLRVKFPQVSIKVLSRDTEKTSLQFNVGAVKRWNPLCVLSALFWSRLVLLGGGGLFQDRTSSFSLYYYLALILAAKLLFKKVYVCAVTINNMSPVNRRVAAVVLNLADKITVRESGSLAALKECGLNTDNISLTADPVFLAPEELKKKFNENPAVTFVLRSSDARDPKAFARLADAVSSAISARVQFVSFHKGLDEGFIKEVSGLTSAAHRVMAWENVGELEELIRGSDIVVSQRLHGLILASLMGVPVIAVSDDPKIKMFMDDLSQKNCFSQSGFAPEAISRAVADAWRNRESISVELGRSVAALRERSKNNIEYVAKLVWPQV